MSSNNNQYDYIDYQYTEQDIIETINRYVDIYVLYNNPVREFEEFVRRRGMEHILIHTPLIYASEVSSDNRAIDRRTTSVNNVLELDHYSVEIQVLILLEVHSELLRTSTPSNLTYMGEVSIDDSEVNVVIYSSEM